MENRCDRAFRVQERFGSTIPDVSKITDLKVSFGTPDVAIASFNGSVDSFRIVKK
jgi:hypothetical protein